MHATREELPAVFGEAMRGDDWGVLRVMVVSLPAGADMASLLRGLPHDKCPCPHWGYVTKGRMRVLYADGAEETLRAGDLFYLPAGHAPVVEEDVEFVEFSPSSEHQAVLDVVKRNATGSA